jgi:hypothetical protein
VFWFLWTRRKLYQILYVSNAFMSIK